MKQCLKKKISADKIFEVAKKEFRERGYEGTTLAVLTKGKDFTSGSVYNCYRNKDSLFALILGEATEDIDLYLDRHFHENNMPDSVEAYKKFELDELNAFIDAYYGSEHMELITRNRYQERVFEYVDKCVSFFSDYFINILSKIAGKTRDESSLDYYIVGWYVTSIIHLVLDLFTESLNGVSKEDIKEHGKKILEKLDNIFMTF